MPRAARRSRSLTERALYEIGRELRLMPAPPLGRRGEEKGKRKEVGTPLTLRPGGPAAASTTDDSRDIDWSDEYDSDAGSEASRLTTPTSPAARAGGGHARPESPDPALDADRVMSAYELQRGLDKLDRSLQHTIRKGGEEDEAYLGDQLDGLAEEVTNGVGEALRGFFVGGGEARKAHYEATAAIALSRLEGAVEGLASQAITAANRGKHQDQVLERIEARLRAIEERPPPPPAAPSPGGEDERMQEAGATRGVPPAPHVEPPAHAPAVPHRPRAPPPPPAVPKPKKKPTRGEAPPPRHRLHPYHLPSPPTHRRKGEEEDLHHCRLS